ncbi:amidohydrolase [Nocardioides baekrokdamisoli]|uniref:Amidohydrolase n=1 Tax=Nocardioides baekrokdamisoli TaxID=1804624 RepID=A0A3G9IGK4_9ACTN|nr:amidohydrolase family protein [Nocardioides baekrokdamisoli]BBH17456.1 amidohydrolase [Nocardioides baekrokdamisoli]
MTSASDHGGEAACLHTIAADLAIPGIIDVHTHFMPKPMLDKVWAYFDGIGPLTGAPWPIAYRLEEDRRLAILREFGVMGFTALSYPHKPGMAEWLNGWGRDFAAAHPDVISSATFYPEPGAGAYVLDAIEDGARVFKAHVQVGDYDPNDPLLDDVWDLLQQTSVPVVIHSGHGPAAGRFTGPEGMAALLARFPQLVLVIAHMGMPDYTPFLDLATRFEGVHLDTTMAFTDFAEGRTPFPVGERGRLLEVGPKVLFGSDFPNIPYPYQHAVESILRLDLGDDWARGVLHDNAARLLSLAE